MLNKIESPCEDFLTALENGSRRAAFKTNEKWQVNTDVKKSILAIFAKGENQDIPHFPGYVDKHTILPRHFTTQDNVRIVPQGSTVRRGAYVASGVVIMPPSYINIGAYIDQGTMVDSHVLVGSCAQIGKKVHLSAGVQIGGVLEPIGMTPVIVEDGAFIGAGCIIVDGIQIGKNAVLAPGVTLSSRVSVYDIVREKIYEKGAPIPSSAVIVPGMRPIRQSWAKAQGLTYTTPIIVKYRDEQTNAATTLEKVLR